MILPQNHLEQLSGSNMKFLILSLILVSCASDNVQIIRWQGDSYKAIITATDKQDAEEMGFQKAQEFCSKKGMEAIMSGRNSRYKGSLNESTRTTVRTASKIGSAVAAGALVKGDTDFAEKAAAAAAGGLYTTSDRDYETEVIFHCDQQLLDQPGTPESTRLW